MLAWEGRVTTLCAWAVWKRTPPAASRSSHGVAPEALPYEPSASARRVSIVISSTLAPGSRRTAACRRMRTVAPLANATTRTTATTARRRRRGREEEDGDGAGGDGGGRRDRRTTGGDLTAGPVRRSGSSGGLDHLQHAHVLDGDLRGHAARHVDEGLRGGRLRGGGHDGLAL